MKVLLVPDKPGWAFDHRAKDLVSMRLKNIRLSIKYVTEIKGSEHNRYDLIYPMSLSIARKLNDLGIPLNKLATGITSLRVFERQMINKMKFKSDFMRFVKRMRGVNAWSDEIVAIFQPHCSIYKTRIGIDEKLFIPSDERKSNETFTIGWVGRKDSARHRELKGYDIVEEALDGLNVKLEIRAFKENYVPRKQMTGFYQGLDCFICSSRSEGLPNPVLEAASCGVPIITTKVGIVPELIQHEKNGLIVQRTPDAIRRQVVYLMNHPRERQQLAENIRRTVVRNWTWDICRKDWENFFKSIV